MKNRLRGLVFGVLSFTVLGLVSLLLRDFITRLVLLPLYIRLQWLVLVLNSIPTREMVLVTFICCLVPAIGLIMAYPQVDRQGPALKQVSLRPIRPLVLGSLIHQATRQSHARRQLAKFLLGILAQKARLDPKTAGIAEIEAAGLSVDPRLASWLEKPTHPFMLGLFQHPRRISYQELNDVISTVELEVDIHES
jgi:hypothetical protein